MRVTTADLWDPAPGRVLAWRVDGGTPGARVRLSANQHNHLGAAAAGEPSVWLAAAFDVPGALDELALERAFRDLVARHGTLQVGIEPGPIGRRHDPGRLTWRRRPPATTGSVEETRALLRRLLDDGCRPFGYPSFAPVAVSRPTGSTVVFGMDHRHGDAHSVAVAAADLDRLYAAHRSGGDPALPPAACFVASADVPAPWLPADDPRLLAWHRFVADLGDRLPAFPLPLGVAAGERVRQATRVVRLLDADGADGLEGEARAAGATPYALLLRRYADVLSALGAPDRLPLLVPVGTRRTETERRAIGWFTTTVPLVVRAASDVAAVAADLRAAVTLADVPLDQVLATLPRPLARERGDVFMVSWLDYRRLPGRGLSGGHHVSAPTRADDVQLWLSRTDDGIWLRVRHPDTPTAHRTLGAVESAWVALIDGRRTAPG